MRHISICAVFGAYVFALAVHAQSPGGTPAARAIKNPVAATPASATAGAAACKKYCAFCHEGVDKGRRAPDSCVVA